MGIVYQAVGPAGPVALKVLQRQDDERSRRRFLREGRALTQLDHPGIVPCFEVGQAQGQLFLALRLVPGLSLQERIDRGGPLRAADVVELGRQLCAALAHAHAGGVLHRDLKPDNVLLNADGRPVLTDFGLARFVDGQRSQALSLSVKGALMGTPGYWAPEQARGENARIGGATDVYALAGTLYAALTGKSPRGGESIPELFAALERPVTPARSLAPETPHWLSDLLGSCLADDPEARPTLTEFAAALETAGSGQSRWRRRSLVWLAVGLLAAALAERATRSRDPVPLAHASPAPSAPPWYAALHPLRRPPLPLPAGVRMGEEPAVYVNATDGSRLVWIPSGAFVMGELDGDPDERPLRRVAVPGFFLGRYEVTWAQFAAFCDASGRELPPTDVGIGGANYEPGQDHPVYNVTWSDAQAYCEWAGLRLPSEAEWEYAARGPGGQRYAWGDVPLEERPANLGHAPDRRLAPSDERDGFVFGNPVGALPLDRSPFGVFDMGGNAREWVADGYHQSYDGAPRDGSAWVDPSATRLSRGGSWLVNADRARATNRNQSGGAGDYVRGWLGFRVARAGE
jgi:formylglycine-generating enzyme required for sulfatase activity